MTAIDYMFVGIGVLIGTVCILASIVLTMGIVRGIIFTFKKQGGKNGK